MPDIKDLTSEELVAELSRRSIIATFNATAELITLSDGRRVIQHRDGRQEEVADEERVIGAAAPVAGSTGASALLAHRGDVRVMLERELVTEKYGPLRVQVPSDAVNSALGLYSWTLEAYASSGASAGATQVALEKLEQRFLRDPERASSAFQRYAPRPAEGAPWWNQAVRKAYAERPVTEADDG